VRGKDSALRHGRRPRRAPSASVCHTPASARTRS
jgi:hypothetical protein